jgi:hypothetical protein
MITNVNLNVTKFKKKHEIPKVLNVIALTVEETYHHHFDIKFNASDKDEDFKQAVIIQTF